MNKVEKFTIIGELPEDQKVVFMYTDLNMWELADKKILRDAAHDHVITTAGHVYFSEADENGIVDRTKINKISTPTKWQDAPEHIVVTVNFKNNKLPKLPDGYGVYGILIQPKEEHKIVFGLYNLKDPSNDEKTIWFFPTK